MNSQLHPIMAQALAPFAPKPAPKFKGAAGNKNLSPIVTAKVMHYGPNDYRVILDCEAWEQSVEFKRSEQFGIAFGHALWFSSLPADGAEWEIHKARAFLRACQ